MEGLLTWLNANNCIEVPVNSIEQLSDGVALFHLAAEASPKHFDKTKIIYNAQKDSLLKQSNLTPLLESLLNFFLDNFHVTIKEGHLPNILLISEKNDPQELLKLIKLVVCCVMFCDRREEFISRLLATERSVQSSIMSITKEMLSSYPSLVDLNSEDPLTVPDSRETFKENFLQESIENLKVENFNLKQTLEDLKDEIKDCHNLETHTIPGKAVFAANLELKQLKEELGSLDFELKKKNAENIQLKEEKKSLEYELIDLQELRRSLQEWKDKASLSHHNTEKLQKLERQLVGYRTKLETLKEALNQSERNSQYFESENKSLKEKIKKIKSAYEEQQNSEDAYQNKLHDEQVEIALQSANDKIVFLETACQQYVEKIHELEDKMDHFEHAESSVANLSVSEVPGSLGTFINEEADFLQLPNAQISDLLENNLILANKNKLLESQNEALEEKIQQLEQAEKSRLLLSSDAEVTNEQNYLLQSELATLKAHNEELEENLNSTKLELDAITKQFQKELELGVGSDFQESIRSLQNELNEKENQLSAAKAEYEKCKKRLTLENRLIASYVYEFGKEIQKVGAAERLQSRGNLPFLTQQRKTAFQNFMEELNF